MYFNAKILILPILLAVMVLGMNYQSAGTDLGAQVFALDFVKDQDPIALLADGYDTKPGVYYAIYVYLYQYTNIEPLHYISIIACLNYIIIFFLLDSYAKKIVPESFGKDDLIMIATILSFSPIFFCVTRFLLAVVLVLGFTYLFFLKRFIFSLIPLILSIYVHDGAKLLWGVLLVAFTLQYLCFPFIKTIKTRNILVLLVCFVLFSFGPFFFTLLAQFIGDNSLMDDKYNDYLESSSGDGVYKYVLIASMSGIIINNIVVAFYDRKNDFFNSVVISSLFFTCFFFNHKIFMVQRIYMFLPVFLGCSLLNILVDESSSFVSKMNICNCLYIVVFVFFCQLFFWRDIFFTF